MSLQEFLAVNPASDEINGNTAWARTYAREIRRVMYTYANNSPRSLQTHLGPSELGTTCDLQVVGKMVGVPATNHISDPWPSIIGTAVHAWLEKAFRADNPPTGLPRWVVEQRVVPVAGHAGTADLYDVLEQAVVDHKVLGPTSMDAVMAPDGPPRKYQIQLLLYGRGYRNLGLPVKRVVLVAYPRTQATLKGLYVWERTYDSEADALVDSVLADTARRAQIAEEVRAGRRSLWTQVERDPSSGDCFFCPFYRPHVTNGPGCPGK